MKYKALKNTRFAKYVLLVLLFVVPALNVFSEHEELSFDFESFKKKASVSYEKTFDLDISLQCWNAMLDRPTLMGQLWGVIEAKPLYRISNIGTTVHVVDPTGIEGRLSLIKYEYGNRLYYGSGKMNRWFVPMTLKGKAVVVIDSKQNEDGSISVVLNIYGEGGKDRITRLMLKSVSPIICYGIERRVKRNLKDLERMLILLRTSPRELREKLQGSHLAEFDALLNDIVVNRI